MLDDLRINFAISQRGSSAGVNHLGFQVDDEAELEEVHGRLEGAEGTILAEKDVSCCYARSDKYWITDPQGVAWETFRSLGTVPFYGDADAAAEPGKDARRAPQAAVATAALPKIASKSCCAPAAETVGGSALLGAARPWSCNSNPAKRDFWISRATPQPRSVHHHACSYHPLLAFTTLHHQQHHRHLDQHPDHGGQRCARLEAEQADRGGDRELEEIGGADQGRRAGNVVLFAQRAIEPDRPTPN